MSKKTGGVARSYVDGFFVKSDEVDACGAKLQPKEVFRGAHKLKPSKLMITILGFSPIWITLGPIVVINCILLASYLLYQLWGRGRLTREFEGAKNQGSRLLSSGTREWWLWTTDPIVRLFVKLHMGPNAITSLGFLIALLSAFFYGKGWFGFAGWTMIFAASFDIFDGRVARITGKSSRSGAFFDAVMDRFSEGACFLGLAVYFRESAMLPAVIAALVGSMLVSYTRARGEGVGVDCKVGWMQRPERIVYLGVASVFDPVITMALHRLWATPPPLLVIVAIIFIAIMTNATAIYRMIYIMNALDTEDKREKESIPQLITKLITPDGRMEVWERARYGYDRRRSEHAHVILFLISGISAEVFKTLVYRGDLPNISAHIIERGGLSQAVGAFPSAMGTATAPFVTGAFPGTCDIPGSCWFDRTVPPTRVLTMNRFRDYLGWGAYAMDHDLSHSVRTIFEYSRRAVNIFGMPNRGCGLVRDPAFFRMAGSFHRARKNGDIETILDAAYRWFVSAIRRDTDFVLYTFPSVEMAGKNNASLEAACHSLRRIDVDIGRAADFIRKQGMYDETALMLAGTYAQTEIEGRFDLEEFLSKRYKLGGIGRGQRDWQDSNLIAMQSGTSMAHLYVKGSDSWSDRTFFEDVERRGLVGALLENDDIDILAGRSVEGGIAVQSRRGRAHLHEDGDGRITYLVKGGDPFGYRSLPQVMDSKMAILLSAHSQYPDGILQVLQIFRSRRTGDIVLSAAEGVTLGSNREEGEFMATSGSLSRSHLIVPVASSVAIGESDLRTVDVFAYILEMLGIEPAHAMDGVISEQRPIQDSAQISVQS